VVLVGDLSHYAANMIFQQSGAIIKTIPIDEQGLDVDYIKTRFVRDNSCICANRDYPTTVSLTAERRLKLLQLAKEYQFAIIEDDYDYDFQFEGLATYGQLRCKWNGIYLGKLGLFPSFQTGFVVAQKI
jgi:GntR family transcriptional regulator/MocR family aminotransferase